MSIILGNTELKNALFLAPMAGYSDRAMRHICHAHGAEASVTEMVSATAVAYGDRKTFDLAKILPDEGPVLLQIFGAFFPEGFRKIAVSAVFQLERCGMEPFRVQSGT